MLKTDENRRQLADLCVKRTFGKRLFLLEFLTTLQQEGFVHYDDTIECWSWDLAAIEEATMSTANVVVLLQDEMRTLGIVVIALKQVLRVPRRLLR